MLTRAENAWNLRALSTLSTLNLLPIRLQRGVVSGQRRFCLQHSRFRLLLWRVNFIVGLVYTVYILATLIFGFMRDEEFRIDQKIFHCVYLATFVLNNFWGFVTFVLHPTEVLIVLNNLFCDDLGAKKTDDNLENAEQGELIDVVGIGREAPSSPAPRPLLTLKVRYSIHELLALTLPFICFGSYLVFFVILGVDPTRVQLFYYWIPVRWRHPLVYLLLTSVEGYYLISMFSIGYLAVILMIEFFEECEKEFDKLQHQLGELMKLMAGVIRSADIQAILRDAKHLFLFIHMFNLSFPWIILSLKMLCLSVSIFFYFFTIRHSAEHPFLAIFTTYIALACTAFYSIIFMKAFKIPGNLEDFKTGLLVLAQKSVGGQKAEFQREVRALRDVAILVGNFGMLERTSTPEFVDFVLNQVVSLLVSFP